MADKHDKFQLLKSKYLEKVRTKERELAGLKSKLQLIEELETESESLNGEVATDGKYRDTKLTEAILDAIQTIAVSAGVGTPAIAQYLLSQGFRPKGKNFKISVGTTLKRLAGKQNKITTEKKDGDRLYKAKTWRISGNGRGALTSFP